jgi:glycosyltransferase involved in cell wall biosynthesis
MTKPTANEVNDTFDANSGRGLSVAILGTRGYPSYYGGFETAVRHLAPYLADAGWDVTVYGRPGSTREDDPSTDSRVTRRTSPGLDTKSISTLSFGLTSTLDVVWRKPDVALVMNVANGYWLPLLRARGIPSLVNVDGIEWDRAKWGRIAKAVFHTGAVATSKHATGLVYDSHEIARRWGAEFHTEGTFIPYGGVQPGANLPLEEGLEHRGYVLVVARFVPENTIPEFIEAARALSAEYEIVIVGSTGYGGPLDEAVASLTASSTRVHWLGHINDDARLYSLWQHAGAYFHGHSVGGTNPALVQAMACGAPVIARDTPYNREVLGGAGHFTAPDAAAIERAVREVMQTSELQEVLAANSVKRSLGEYSWESVCSKYELELRSLATTFPRKTNA